MKRLLKQYTVILMAGFLYLINSGLFASDASLTKDVDDISIYMGIIPTTEIEGDNNSTLSDIAMFTGLRGKKHHVTVALFDSKTGQRITDAKVVVKISEVGMAGNRKELKTQKYGDAVSFGRDFYLADKGLYWIDLSINRTGSKHTTTTRFEWKQY